MSAVDDSYISAHLEKERIAKMKSHMTPEQILAWENDYYGPVWWRKTKNFAAKAFIAGITYGLPAAVGAGITHMAVHEFNKNKPQPLEHLQDNVYSLTDKRGLWNEQKTITLFSTPADSAKMSSAAAIGTLVVNKSDTTLRYYHIMMDNKKHELPVTVLK